MSGTVSSSEIGDALVFTSSNRGHSPEEMAEMALNKIMSVFGPATLEGMDLLLLRIHLSWRCLPTVLLFL